MDMDIDMDMDMDMGLHKTNPLILENLKKLIYLIGLFTGINATAQIATSGTTNSGTNSSAIGYQTSATNIVSTAIERNFSEWPIIYCNRLSNLCNKYCFDCHGR